MDAEIKKLIKIVQQSPKTGLPWTVNSLEFRKEVLEEAIRNCEARAGRIKSPSPMPDGARLLAATYRRLVEVLDEVLETLKGK